MAGLLCFPTSCRSSKSVEAIEHRNSFNETAHSKYEKWAPRGENSYKLLPRGTNELFRIAKRFSGSQSALETLLISFLGAFLWNLNLLQGIRRPDGKNSVRNDVETILSDFWRFFSFCQSSYLGKRRKIPESCPKSRRKSAFCLKFHRNIFLFPRNVLRGRPTDWIGWASAYCDVQIY